jgi:hypothetical protein
VGSNGFNGKVYKINFVEQDVILSSNGEPVAAQCSDMDMVNGSVTIKLSKSALPGMSANYQKAAILHEMMHAYMQAKGQRPDHEQFLGTEFFDNLLYGAYRDLGLSVKDAIALGLYGTSDLAPFDKQDGIYKTNSPNYMGVLDKYNTTFPTDRLTIAQIVQIGDSYSNTTRDSQNKITKLGGSNCL